MPFVDPVVNGGQTIVAMNGSQFHVGNPLADGTRMPIGRAAIVGSLIVNVYESTIMSPGTVSIHKNGLPASSISVPIIGTGIFSSPVSFPVVDGDDIQFQANFPGVPPGDSFRFNATCEVI